MFNVSLKEISGLLVGEMVYKYVHIESLCGFLFLQQNEVFFYGFSLGVYCWRSSPCSWCWFVTLRLVVLGFGKDSHWWRTWFCFMKKGSENTALFAHNSVWLLLLQRGGWRRLCQVFSLKCFHWALFWGFEDLRVSGLFQEEMKILWLVSFSICTHNIYSCWYLKH